MCICHGITLLVALFWAASLLIELGHACSHVRYAVLIPRDLARPLHELKTLASNPDRVSDLIGTMP